MINIFIDTNVYLSFYRLSSDDVEKLEILVELIKEAKEAKLFTTTQIIDEFSRNRDSVVAEALKVFSEFSKSAPYVPFMKKYEDCPEYLDSYKEFLKRKKKMEDKINDDVEQFRLPSDQLIEALFNVSERIEATEDIIKLSRNRYDKWNPPGKKWSYWDAINWECLLKGFPDKENLYFIWMDGDYVSSLGKTQFNSFLQKEWSDKKQSSVLFYEKISLFLKNTFPQIGNLDEYRKDSTIDRLSVCRTFDAGRRYLGQLKSMDNFSIAQIRRIVEASIWNDQVWWAHKYNPSQSGEVLSKIMEWRHRDIPPEYYDEFCWKFGINKEIFYYTNQDGEKVEIPF